MEMHEARNRKLRLDAPVDTPVGCPFQIYKLLVRTKEGVDPSTISLSNLSVVSPPTSY